MLSFPLYCGTLTARSALIISFSRCLSLDRFCKNTRPPTNGTAGLTTGNVTDTALFKRPVRGEPGKVKCGIIPIEWFNFFMPKTGVSGFYTFMVTTGVYLTSKEILVMEHNFYNGLSMFVLCVAITTNYGKKIGQAIDKHVDQYEELVSHDRNSEKKMYEDGIADEKNLQWSCEGQQFLVDAKRENVLLQLEEEYRKRLFHVYNEVKKRLDCQVELGLAEGRFVQKNIVSYVVNGVQQALTPDFLNQYMDKCIQDLEVIVKKKL